MLTMKIGRYETVRLLGKGGMSEVYEVEDLRLGSRYALKLFTYEKDDSEVRDRFLVEGKLLARLSHPRVVRVTDFGTDETSGRPYFVMDLVLNGRGEMRSLSDVEPGTVDEEQVGVWYDDLREGLAYIHGHGVVHRDLKLQNVLIGPDGHAVLTDFGISKVFDPKGDGVQIVDTVRTLVKMREGRSLVMGSLGYMAPELEMGVAASPQSDWYALGVIVYRLLTGTWCDSRTDVLGTLETYDPVWKRILPKLLHSNPNGRECLSYADEKRVDRERFECELEDRWLKEKSRGHLARHLARWLALVLVLLVGASSWVCVRFRDEVASLEDKLSVPDFESVFSIPAEAGEESEDEMPSREDFRCAMIDALVLTQGLFADLRKGDVTETKVRAELLRLAEKARNDDMDLYSRAGENYGAEGDSRALFVLLKAAAGRMKEAQEP